MILRITGLTLTDTNYTVIIIPVNIIGYGPSTTVNGTVILYIIYDNVNIHSQCNQYYSSNDQY